jgi:5-formyltetrahydrofolate cyclo-ligase
MEKIKFKNKSEFRAFSQAKLLKTHSVYQRNKYMNMRMMSLISLLNVRSILCYIPLDIEVDSRPLINALRKKYMLYVPFMEGLSFKMVKYRLPLEVKRFNIKEPKSSLAMKPKIDLAIVPVIGVDGALKRIGFGKGMYDRFFDSLTSKPTVLFVQRETCLTQAFLGEEHDIAADIYLTPQHTIIQRGYHGLRSISGRGSVHYRRCRVFHRQKDGSGQL